MTLESAARVGEVQWVGILAELELAVREGERMVEHGDFEELRAFPVPVVASGLPPELAGRARRLQDRMTALNDRVVAAMNTNRRELQVVSTERASRPERPDRAVRQWQPSYVDARA